ncbi:MAG: methyltransferase [Glycocaulis sp.]
MTANTSSAVMAQRHEPHDSLDDFPTPPWAVRALIEHVICHPALSFSVEKTLELLASQRVWEPACNRGYMALTLGEYFSSVHASDIHDYSMEWPQGSQGQTRVCDFLMPGTEPGHFKKSPPDWIITNPPFRLGVDFVQRAFALRPRVGVAMFVRTAFLEGQARFSGLFGPMTPSAVGQFTGRVVLHKGTVRDPDQFYTDAAGKLRKPSTATAYCWVVWLADRMEDRRGRNDCRLVWIPPCRKALTRPGDYRNPPSDTPGGKAAASATARPALLPEPTERSEEGQRQ